MPISLQHRRVGGISVVTCTGRIVEGPESVELRQCLDDQLELGPYVLVNVGAVDFVDSSGLGLLVRYTMRVRNANGVMKLCSVSRQLATILKATRLDGVFETHETEEEAIEAFFQRQKTTVERGRNSDVLCLIGSMDVQALVREMLTHAGFGVLSAGNLPDGVMLLRATRPKVIVIDQDLRQNRGTGVAAKFSQMTTTTPVIELPDGFSQRDPAEASRELLDQIRATGVVS